MFGPFLAVQFAGNAVGPIRFYGVLLVLKKSAGVDQRDQEEENDLKSECDFDKLLDGVADVLVGLDNRTDEPVQKRPQDGGSQDDPNYACKQKYIFPS